MCAGAETNRLAERGSHCPSAAAALRRGHGKRAGWAAPETTGVWRGGGQRKPGAELAVMPQGRLEGVRRHARLYSIWTRAGKVKGGGTVAHEGATGSSERFTTSWHKDEKELGRIRAPKRAQI